MLQVLNDVSRRPWNKGKLTGQRPPLKLKEIWGIRVRLQLREWVASIGLDPPVYGAHSLRRTEPTLIYRQTKNLRAVQSLLGHATLESTVRYLGIEVEDALEIAENTDA